MSIQLSPSVSIKEIDLTNVVPAVSTSIGAAVIEAGWGPVNEVVTINSENSLVTRFGRPNDLNSSNWFAAANFLAYSNNLLVVRTNTRNQRNAVTTLTYTVSSIPVASGGANYLSAVATISAPTDVNGLQATADVIIVGGVITEMSITNPGSGYSVVPTVTIVGVAVTGQTISNATLSTAVTVSGGIKLNNLDRYTSSYENDQGIVGEFAAKYPGSIGNSLRVSMADAASFATWGFRGLFSGPPGTSSYAASRGGSGDELHIVVVDKDAKWSGVAGTVLEKFEYVSKASDGRKSDGSSAYYRTVIKEQSQFVWNMLHIASSNWGTDVGSFAYTSIGSTAITRDLSGGVDHYIPTTGQRIDGFTLFADAEAVDVSLVIAGKANAIIANWVIQNLAEARKDCLVFISPEDVSSGSILIGNTSDITARLIAFRNALPSSSYCVIDSGYKYQYDRYADKYRWVPLNGDIAGLCARTDETNDPWFSPAGFTRGSIKNVVKLAFNPPKTDRDNLYITGINPVVSFPGQGVVLFGDKTALSKPSAFDRINVRRLFIVLEKAIATAAKYQLFEINDIQTRAQFIATIEPFLRDVKGRRGVYDFRVICDTTNNTPTVVDGNRFVASIFISPARSINFIELSFVATRTGVSFEEIAGSV